MNRGIDTLKAGAFVSVALFLFIFSIFYLGKEREIFSSQANYYVSFKDVKGLSEGAPVRLGGVIIGRVAKIEFSPDSTILVTLSINDRFLDRIREDSKVTLETQGLLGDKFASISVGKAEAVLPAGSILNVSSDGDVSEILGKAAKVVDNTVSISSDIKGLTEAIGQEGAQDLKASIKEFRALVGTLSAIASEVKNGKGLANAIIYDPAGQKTVKSLSEIALSLSSAAKEIEVMVGELKDNNDASVGNTLTQLNEAAKNIKVASELLKNGNGTLGALLVDAKLYDSLVEITDGAQRNFILRQAVRSSLKE